MDNEQPTIPLHRSVVLAFVLIVAIAQPGLMILLMSKREGLEKQADSLTDDILEARKSIDSLHTRASNTAFELLGYRWLIGAPSRKKGFLISDGAVACPLNRFIIIRDSDTIGLVKFSGSDDDFSVIDYQWYNLTDPEGSFGDPEVASGDGSLRENFSTQDVLESEDDRGQATAEFGSIRLRWSSPTWLYLPFDRDCEFALTETADLSEVDHRDRSLIWYGRRKQ